LDECGRQVMQAGDPMFQYTVSLPQPISMPSGMNYHFGVRTLSNPSQPSYSYLPSSYRDPSVQTLPSYFLSQYYGYPQAVPVSQIADCDHDFVAFPITGSTLLSPPGGNGHGTNVTDELPLDPTLEPASPEGAKGGSVTPPDIAIRS